MAHHGGKRAGSGRPKGSQASHTLAAQEFRRLLIQRISEEAVPIIEALIKRAKAGDMQAIKETNDRVIGKVKDKVELDGRATFSLTELLHAADQAK